MTGHESTAANPSHTYSTATVKTFAAKLTVTNIVRSVVLVRGCR